MAGTSLRQASGVPDAGPASLPEMPAGECMARSAFQVLVEGLRLSSIRKVDRDDDLPRPISGGMRRLSIVVLCQATSEVARGTDVTLSGVGQALEEVDASHRAALLRANPPKSSHGRIGTTKGTLHSPDSWGRRRVVEAAGIEPASEEEPTEASPSAAPILNFAPAAPWTRGYAGASSSAPKGLQFPHAAMSLTAAVAG